MGTELPKTQDSSGNSDSNDSENSSSSDSSGSDWECVGSKQNSVRKPHFSVTSCDTGLKLKIAAIPPRKAEPKKSVKPAVKKKPVEESKVVLSPKNKNTRKLSQLSESSTSSESCSKCSSDCSSDDDIPLKTVSKTLMKCSPQKGKGKLSVVKSESEDDTKDRDTKEHKNNKNKSNVKSNACIVKKGKSDEGTAAAVKRGRGRPRTKDLNPRPSTP